METPAFNMGIVVDGEQSDYKGRASGAAEEEERLNVACLL